MKKFSVSLNKLALFLLVFLPIYQDSPFSIFLGAAGYTVLMPVSLIGIFLCALVYSKIPRNVNTDGLIVLGKSLTVISFVAILIWLILGNPIIVVSEFLPLKAIKVCLQYFSYIAYILLVVRYARRTGSWYIGYSSFITLIVLTIVCIIEKTQIPCALRSLHFAGVFPYGRVRLLTTEASWTAMMIYVYTMISIVWALNHRKILALWCTIVCGAYLLFNTNSKTLIMALAITLVIYTIIAFRSLSRKKVVILLLVALFSTIVAQFIVPQLMDAFNNDIQNYTSVATRGYTIFIGIIIGIVFPFGVGGAVYLGVLQEFMQRFLFVFDKLPIKLNLSEIDSLIHSSSGTALTVKSGLIQYNVEWGIFGTLYLLMNISGLAKSVLRKRIKYKEMLVTTFISSCVLIATAQNFSFEFWLHYGFLVCLDEEADRADDGDWRIE